MASPNAHFFRLARRGPQLAKCTLTSYHCFEGSVAPRRILWNHALLSCRSLDRGRSNGWVAHRVCPADDRPSSTVAYKRPPPSSRPMIFRPGWEPKSRLTNIFIWFWLTLVDLSDTPYKTSARWVDSRFVTFSRLLIVAELPSASVNLRGAVQRETQSVTVSALHHHCFRCWHLSYSCPTHMGDLLRSAWPGVPAHPLRSAAYLNRDGARGSHCPSSAILTHRFLALTARVSLPR